MKKFLLISFLYLFSFDLSAQNQNQEVLNLDHFWRGFSETGVVKTAEKSEEPKEVKTIMEIITGKETEGKLGGAPKETKEIKKLKEKPEETKAVKAAKIEEQSQEQEETKGKRGIFFGPFCIDPQKLIFWR